MKKKSKFFLFFALLVIAGFMASVIFLFVNSRPVLRNSGEDVRVEIRSGASAGEVAVLLKKSGIIKDSKLFYYSIRFPFLCRILFPSETMDGKFVLKSGIYHLTPSMNYVQLQKVLSSGVQEYVKVACPEGLTISQIAAILEKNDICSAGDFISYCKSEKPLEKYGIPAESCEGFLFPDTYFLTHGMNAQTVADLMIETFFERIKEIPGYSDLTSEKFYETVILASIVEREYRLESEAPLIASVFKNRLSKGIGLYSCATVVYIITEIQGRPHPDRVLISDTQIDNPYNTYKWAGLTPGPISNPGLVALNAAANAPKTNYYFFQIVDQKAGKHVFSTTFEEHKINHNLDIKK